MSNRTVMVDNNTWNNTHIATVGLAMARYITFNFIKNMFNPKTVK